MGFDPERYWNDRHAKTSGLAGVGYLGLRGLNPWMYRVRQRVFARVVRGTGIDVGGARILDAGSGTGFYLNQWRRLGARDLTGSDFSDVARERLRGDFPGVPIEALDIGSEDTTRIDALGQFDLVSVMDVLYHLVDDAVYARALRNLGRLLRPGGRLIFTENFLQAAPRVGNDWHTSRTLTEIEQACATGGLTLESRRPWFMLMNDPVDSSSRAHKRAWWAVRKASEKIPGAGYALGAALYPAEVVLTKAARESPTSEIAVAKLS